MKKIIAGLTMAATLFASAAPVFALTQSEAKDAWIQAQKTRMDADAAYRQAQIDYQASKTPENEQKVVDTAKTVLSDALDEAQAWLDWKKLEADGDARVPSDIKQNIDSDVAKNLAKIDGFRTDVAGITNRAQVLVVFLKIVGGYVELVTDVARNSGSMWVYIGQQLSTKASDYEAKLRVAAADLPNNADIIAKLDSAQSEIDLANGKIEMAKAAYQKVTLPGTPLLKFAEGNEDLRGARLNLLNAEGQMEQALRLIGTN